MGGWGWGVGKCVTKENPKSDLDLDSGFVNKVRHNKLCLCHLIRRFSWNCSYCVTLMISPIDVKEKTSKIGTSCTFIFTIKISSAKMRLDNVI